MKLIKCYLETMAAIAPAHKCLVVLTAPRRVTLTFRLATTTSPLLFFFAPFCKRNSLGSETSPSLLKLTDKKNKSLTAVDSRFWLRAKQAVFLEAEESLKGEMKSRKEEEKLGSMNKPPGTSKFELEGNEW